MTEFNTLGYYAIMTEIKSDIGMNRDYGLDLWGSSSCWAFALADYMWLWCGEILPGYKPSPLARIQSACEESPELVALLDMDEEWTDEDIRKAFKVLTRYREWLEAAGKSY